MHTSLRRIAMVAAAVTAVGVARAASPGTAEARWHGGGWHGGWHGHSGWGGFGWGFAIGGVIASCGGLASATRGPFCNFGPGPRAGGRRRCQSTFRRHMIDDQHADHDADQQRRQKQIFHFVDPFALQTRTVHPTENFAGSGVRPSFAERQLTFHGDGSTNRARAGTTTPPSRKERPGKARPFAIRG